MTQDSKPLVIDRKPAFSANLAYLCEKWQQSEEEVIRRCISCIAGQEGMDEKGLVHRAGLVEIGNSQPPVFAVISLLSKAGPYTEEERDVHRFMVEENSCPTNFIDCEALIVDGDQDPHGVLRFVDCVAWPDGEDIDWSEHFPDLKQSA